MIIHDLTEFWVECVIVDQIRFMMLNVFLELIWMFGEFHLMQWIIESAIFYHEWSIILVMRK